MISSIYIFNWVDGTLHVNGVVLTALGVGALVRLLLVIAVWLDQ